ncbi:arsenite methyltransferase [Algisphaera agarilytica]|uniref:Arsenite methyltransferase n=1 Tax=Algisphaera agarilytica TaxID=1385975 RepID=A0A7X0LL42_9BACT|nr:arsenite methyltransferase [Algisphaera agarilytica]MBB6430499.1 SAM-dependent methyltransferase [Algisphaera agarilytica]
MTSESCCDPSSGCCSPTPNTEPLTQVIREKYGETARSGLSSSDINVHAVAEAFGYSADELAAIPAEANMGLSCGNPIALANLSPGEVVVDLGSGGGLDVFLAAQKVGPTGRAIGVDMTPDMITLAQRNTLQGPGGKPYTNVDFKLGTIDNLPLADDSVDVIISNCVINLAADKNAVFAEMYRVLKPGGRVAVSDIALKQELPQELADSVAALVGCIAGAIPIDEFESGLKAAGFRDVALIDSQADLTAYAKVDGQAACCAPPSDEAVANSCCTPAATTDQPMHADLGDLFEKYDVNQYAASMKVFALK